jgi:beta-aspartyl-peptidase (threonine type)
MRSVLFSVAALFSVSAFAADGPTAILIHGGAGALEPGRYTAEEEAAFRATLTEALDAGYAVLEGGGAALDAVEAAVVILEDAPMFNAGKGAVFTRDGKNELDASVMDGATKNAGAVAGVTSVKNPIKLARAVMENSRHVMFAREGAEAFAKEQGLEFVAPDYFYTERRWEALQKALAAEKKQKESALPIDAKFGTVGAVALDADGNLAAGTSTGGMTMKQWGRVGDSPIIGAGTYADNESCAVSATGHGEFFIRLTIARDICAQVEYGGKSVEEASRDMIHNRLTEIEASGGVIVLGKDGDYAMAFNSAGMFRGVKTAAETRVAIYGSER